MSKSGSLTWKYNMSKHQSLKAENTFFSAPSLLSLMFGGLSWLGYGSIQPHASWSVRLVQPCGAPGETGCGLTCSMLPSSGSSQRAGQSAQSPHTLFGVSAQCALLGAGLGSAGYRAQMDRWWGLLPSSPMRAGREGEGDRCVYVPLVASPACPPHRGRDGCPWHWFWRRRDRESDKGNRKGTYDGGRERKMGCDGMKIDLIKSAQYKSIEASCRMQSVTKAPPLCIWFPPLTYGLRQETHFQEIHFSQRSPGSLV